MAKKAQPSKAAADLEKSVDLLIALISEHWGEIHHIESERSSLTNILLVAESAIIAFIAESRYATGSQPLAVLLIVIAAVGMLATMKYYERFRYAQERLTELYRAADTLCPDASLFDRLRQANEQHAKNKRLLLLGRYHLGSLPLHRIWFALHCLFLLTGLALAVIVGSSGLGPS